MYIPDEDGVTHINAYSRGRTLLGQMLSNFYEVELSLDSCGHFRSIEGLWFWMQTKDDRLRFLSGHAAKKLGESLTFCGVQSDCEYFIKMIRTALWQKIQVVPNLAQMLTDSSLPIVHYYVMHGNTNREFTVPVKEHDWLWKSMEEYRKNLQLGIVPSSFQLTAEANDSDKLQMALF